MLTLEKLNQLLAIATHEIDNYNPILYPEEGLSVMAEFHFNRAEIYMASKEYKKALQDYNFAIDYDAYFYSAFEGRDLVESIIVEKEQDLPIR